MKENGLKRGGLEFGNFRLYPDERLLLKDGERVPLTPRVLDLLIVLVQRHGDLVSKETLLGTVWPDSFVEEGNINRTVSTLRKSLGEQDNGNDYIETVPKIGYRFIAPVCEQEYPQSVNLLSSTDTNRPEMRPIFWFGAGAGLLALALFASSYVPGSLQTESQVENKEARLPVEIGLEPVRLTFDPARHAYPIWTNDGRIRYQHFGNPKASETYRMTSRGDEQTPVAAIPGVAEGNLSPDGKRVFYWKSEEPQQLYMSNAEGGNEEKLPFRPGNISWAWDSSQLVYQAAVSRGREKDWELFTYDIGLKKSHRVTDQPTIDADPAFSPDGKQIVFASDRDGDFEIYLMDSDGSNVRQLTDHPAWESHPAFSPDGTQIVFNSNRENENYDVYIINTDGGDVSKLTKWESHEEVGPACWSPDGTEIALISNHFGNDDIYVMRVEPRKPELLVDEESANVSAASFSPDGERIVYQAEISESRGELRIRDISSGKQSTLLTTDSSDLRPVWSPDGSQIVFQNKVDGITSLYSIYSNGGEVTRITSNHTKDGAPSWSPDGRDIVFLADDFGKTRLVVRHINDGVEGPLTPNEGWESDPVWSPDGTKIVFACDRQDVPGNGLDICLMDANGENEKRLLSRKGHDVQPTFSPDGSRIAFTAAGDGNNEIYIMRSDGTGLLRLTRNSADDTQPHFAPDGQSIIFTSNRSGRSAIYQIAV